MSTPRTTNDQPPPAAVYDELFVPALFRPWATRVGGLARIEPGHSVLDVACGTGALALEAVERVGEEGRVVGLDASSEMLAVARRKNSPIEWREGRAESLPFVDATFDRVLSQFALMFFDDPSLGLREMARVLRPSGRLVAAVCDGLDHAPGYAVLTELLHRLFGADIAEAFRAPFELGDRKQLRALGADAGLEGAEVRRVDGQVSFPSVRAMVSAERACAWTLGGLLDRQQFGCLLEAAEESLAPFVLEDGSVAFDLPALCLIWDASQIAENSVSL